MSRSTRRPRGRRPTRLRWPRRSSGTIGLTSQQLDSVATSLINEVNNPGVVYNGTAIQTSTAATPAPTSPATTTAPNGAISLLADFFVSTPSSNTSSTAGTIQVSASLQQAALNGITAGQFTSSATPNDNGVTNLQVSTLGTSFAGNYSSDNDVALDEANNSGGAADLAYESFIQSVGSLAQGANNQETTNSALQTQITNQRQSVEGVDLSNEMSNLINEQQSYQASAKVMNAFSTVMDSLMTVRRAITEDPTNDPAHNLTDGVELDRDNDRQRPQPARRDAGELSTGFQINQPSDNPTGAAITLSLQGQ